MKKNLRWADPSVPKTTENSELSEWNQPTYPCGVRWADHTLVARSSLWKDAGEGFAEYKPQTIHCSLTVIPYLKTKVRHLLFLYRGLFYKSQQVRYTYKMLSQKTYLSRTIFKRIYRHCLASVIRSPIHRDVRFDCSHTLVTVQVLHATYLCLLITGCLLLKESTRSMKNVSVGVLAYWAWNSLEDYL